MGKVYSRDDGIKEPDFYKIIEQEKMSLNSVIDKYCEKLRKEKCGNCKEPICWASTIGPFVKAFEISNDKPEFKIIFDMWCPLWD